MMKWKKILEVDKINYKILKENVISVKKKTLCVPL